MAGKMTGKEGMPKGKNAWTVKIGEKGQFVIPKEARDMLGILPGDTILVLGDERKGIAILPKDMMQKYIERIFGELAMEEEPWEEGAWEEKNPERKEIAKEGEGV